MSAAVDGARVLARISVEDWRDRRRPSAEREEVLAWLRANGIDPNNVALTRDVEVVLLDAPAIVREEFVRHPDGGVRRDPTAGGPLTRVVHSVLRVPLPAHLGDPSRGDA